MSSKLGGEFLTNPAGQVQESEDCLFLDIYVPASALDSTDANVPVVVWFFGGGYIFGSKDQAALSGVDFPLYNGTGVLRAAAAAGKSRMIFVTGNYRVGAFGWLAGQSMEQYAEKNIAVPNAGLYDQRLILQFVQQYISKWNGDKAQVSAWGESAGGGSILHHLVAKWNDSAPNDPLFKKAVVLSAAYQWMNDRSANGVIEQAYQNLTTLTNCTSDGIQCLQKLDEKTMAKANQQLWDMTSCTGVFTVGPAVDGKLITQLPAVTFNQGR